MVTLGVANMDLYHHDQEKRTLDEKAIKKYKNNQLILSNMTVGIVIHFLKRYSFLKIDKKYYDKQISYFFRKIYAKFPELECKLNKLIKELFNELKLKNFYTKTFYFMLK